MSHRRGTNPTTLLLLWITLALAAHGCAHDPVPVFTIPTPPPDAATLTGIVVSDDGPVPFANVIVRETRRGAQTDEKGRFAIRNVPPGNYKVRAWHERIPSQTKNIVVPASGEVAIAFTLGFGELAKY